MVRTSPNLTPPRGRGPTQDPQARTIAVFIAWLISIVIVLMLLINIFSSLSGPADEDQNPTTPSQTSSTPTSSEQSETPSEDDSESAGSPSSNSDETGYGVNEQPSSNDVNGGSYEQDSSYTQGSETSQEQSQPTTSTSESESQSSQSAKSKLKPNSNSE